MLSPGPSHRSAGPHPRTHPRPDAHTTPMRFRALFAPLIFSQHLVTFCGADLTRQGANSHFGIQLPQPTSRNTTTTRRSTNTTTTRHPPPLGFCYKITINSFCPVPSQWQPPWASSQRHAECCLITYSHIAPSSSPFASRRRPSQAARA